MPNAMMPASLDPTSARPRLECARRVAITALAIAMPLWPDLVPLTLVSALVLAMPWETPMKAWRFRWPAWSGPLPWFAVWYLWHVVGMAWSSDLGHGGFDLEVKLALGLVPLVMAFRGWGAYRDFALRVFTWAVAGTLLFLMLRACVLFGHEIYLLDQGRHEATMPWTNGFFSSYLSPWLHPSYLAMYATFALAHVVWGPPVAGRWRSAWRVAVPVVLLLGTVLCASKAGWVGLAVVLAYALVQGGMRTAVRRWVLRGGIAAFAMLLIIGTIVPSVGNKVTEVWSAITQGAQPDATDSSGARRLVWSAAREVVAQQPWLGTGTGDVKNALMAVYAERGYTYPLEWKLNAHSQLVQSAVALGVPSALWLLAGLLVPLVHAWRKHEHLLAVLLLLSLLNWAVESMLEVQAGVVFFSIVAAWLWRRNG